MDLNYPSLEAVWNLPVNAHIFRDVHDVPNAIVARAVPIPTQVHWLIGDADGIYRLVDSDFVLPPTSRLASTFRRLPEHPDHHRRRFMSFVNDREEVYLVMVDDEEDLCVKYEKE